MSSWAESIWIIQKIKSALGTQTSAINSLGTTIKGSTSTSVTLSDAIDKISQLDNVVYLQINPAEGTTTTSS